MALTINRRSLLRGVGGAAVGLPFLEAMAPGRKAHAAGIKRLLIFFTPNGTIYKNWRCTGTGTDFAFSRILKPLEPYRAKLNILEGPYHGSGGSIGGPGDDHMKGMGWMLTGRPLLAGNTPTGGGQPPAGLASGISVDQEIANKIGGSTRFKSLEFGVGTGSGSGNPLFNMIYAGSNQALPAQMDPARMFFRTFGDFKPAPAVNDPGAALAAADRQSVVNAVKGTFSSLSKRVSAADRIKLERHLANISDLEGRLTVAAPAVGGTCKVPASPPDMDASSEANFAECGKNQMDLAVNALACDLTRVASIQWSRSSGGPTFKSLGATRGHHDISHDGDTIAESVELMTKIDTWYAEQFAALIGKMDAIDDGGGKTLLDNSLVIWVNELAKGNAHTHNPLCYVLAGSAAGALQTGRNLAIRESANNLLVSMMNLMDVPATNFGEPGFSTGPLKGL